LKRALCALATDTAGKLDVLRHDGDTLGVNGTQVGVLKERGQVGFRSLLQGHDGVGLEAEVSLEILGHLAHEALKGKLADEELGRLLVLADLAERNGAGPEAVGLLDAACGGGGLSCSL